MSDGLTGRKSAQTVPNRWDAKTIRLRIEDPKTRQRFAAGCPNADEIKMYEAATRNLRDKSIALVLGMTPELRKLTIRVFCRVVTADNNPDAIATYKNWLSKEEQHKEHILETDWFDLEQHLNHRVSAIMGDGIFGNLVNFESHVTLLQLLSRLLSDGGVLIVRKALIPANFDPDEESFENKLKLFRQGALDRAEFGLASRILGFYRHSYNPETYILDSRDIRYAIQKKYRQGRITKTEFHAMNRYSYNGRNCILPQEVWERLLSDCGFKYRIFECLGKDWYRYYKIYQCRPA